MSDFNIGELGQGQNINTNKCEVDEKEEEEQLSYKKATDIARGLVVPMALKTAIELNVLDIISEAGSCLSPTEVAGRIRGCVNPDAPAVLDRFLGLLTSISILECKLRSKANNEVERVYGVGPVCKYFLTDKKDGLECSLRPWFLVQYDKLSFDIWDNMSGAILEGGIPFNKVYGRPYYEFTKTDLRLNKLFNESMANMSTFIMKKILDIYQGFEGINILVDVGGGAGMNLSLIITNYPDIKGINFDLPHVLAEISYKIQGVENVEGDMFEGVPNGDAIFLKWILHNWKDEQCLIILKNCWKALPENGKVIVVEALLPSTPNCEESQDTHELDITMFGVLGAKERTKEEFEALASQSGFSSCRVVCSVANMWVIEFHKAY